YFAFAPFRRAHAQAVVRIVLAFRDEGIVTDNAIAADGGAVQHHGLDADQAVVADGAAMQHGLVTDRHALADIERKAFVGMQNAVILNIGARADNEVVDVAAQHRVEPDANILAQHYAAQHDRILGSV